MAGIQPPPPKSDQTGDWLIGNNRQEQRLMARELKNMSGVFHAHRAKVFSNAGIEKFTETPDRYALHLEGGKIFFRMIDI